MWKLLNIKQKNETSRKTSRSCKRVQKQQQEITYNSRSYYIGILNLRSI